MSDKPNDGGPAFPSKVDVCALGEWYEKNVPGMTLRDWFAGQAMAAMLTAYKNTYTERDGCGSTAVGHFRRDFAIDPNGVTGINDGCVEVAEDAYKFADAMLAARERKGGAS